MWKVNSQCLSIHDIEIIAPIGVYDFEKKEKNTFLLSVDLWGDFSQSLYSDNIHDTLDYQIIYQIAIETFQKESNLIERVCYEIAERIKKINFDLCKIRVYIRKLSPPVGGKVLDTAFELVLER